jgi:adenosylcobinamide-phosphate synthase
VFISVSLLGALTADQCIGEVSRYHPLVGFGRVVNWLESRSRQFTIENNPASVAPLAQSPTRERWMGALCWSALVILPTVGLWHWQTRLNDFTATLLAIVVLYFCIGGRSLVEHASAVERPLAGGDLPGARQQLSRIVSRDTVDLDGESVAKATVESVLENGSDALLAPIFWFVVAGAPGVLCYRLSNTLDAMWGYRTVRFLNYGCTAARMDDLLNWLPARCCALSYALVGRRAVAMRCWRTQAALCESPNAGPVMAAGAGALGITLGGAASYDNTLHWRPLLGEGVPAASTDIARAVSLLRRATVLWLAVIVGCEFLLWH